MDAVSHSACAMATDLKAKFIIVNSLSGHTARMVSRFRCPVDIIGMTYSEGGWRKLNLSWGVILILCGKFNSMEAMFQHDLSKVQEVFPLKTGDNLVLTGGVVNGSTGNTNLLKVEQI
nr:pyruvate kinase alpha/beta domain-containing protein [Blautia sp.]